MRTLIGVLKLIVYAIASLLLILIQGTILKFTRGPFALIYPQIYHAQCCRIFGVKILIEGVPERGERIIYVGNHISYLDIPIVGSVLKGSFVAKKEIASWPVLGLLGSLGQSLYISRAPQDAAKATQMLTERLEGPNPVILFPEGTSTNGSSILPFKSSSFEIFLNKNLKIQPFTISIMEVDGKPASTQTLRDQYAWYADMTLVPHLWAFAKSKGCVVKVTFQKILPSTSFESRKILCAAAFEGVVKGLDLSPMAE